MGSEISKKDITRLGFRSSLLQASFNYERMQAGGFTWAMLPILKKIYKDDKPGLSAAMKDNLEFINTHPNLVGFLMGLLISMEEKGENRDTIKGLKVALFGPIAGIGDAIFWFTLLPIMAGICSSARETCWGRFYFSPFTCLSFSCASAGPTSVIQSA